MADCEYDELLARLDKEDAKYAVRNSSVYGRSAAAIRSLQAQLEAEHKALEEADLTVKRANKNVLDANLQAATASHRADAAELRMKEMTKRYQEQGDSCLRRTEAAESRLAEAERMLEIQDAVIAERDEAERRLAEVEQDARRWKGLIELAGYWQDGSHTPVLLDQDECMHMCFIKVGKKLYGTDNSSFRFAIDAAIKESAEQEKEK